MKQYLVEFAVYGYVQVSDDEYEPEIEYAIEHAFMPVDAESIFEAKSIAIIRIEHESSLDIVDSYDVLAIEEEQK